MKAIVTVGHFPMHVSSSTRTSVNDIANKLTDIHGSPTAKHFTSLRVGNSKYSFLSNEKEQRLLIWKSRVVLLEGLKNAYQHL